MKVDNNADPRDFLFLMIEKKPKKQLNLPKRFHHPARVCP